MGTQRHHVHLQASRGTRPGLCALHCCWAHRLSFACASSPPWSALGTMPCEKFGQSYHVCVGKGKRAALWEQAMPYQLASVTKKWPHPDLFPSLNKLKDRFHSKCMKHFVFSKSSVLAVLFSSALLPTKHHNSLSCLSSSFHQSHHLLTDYVSGCWISLEITQCCFIKERKSICTLNEFSCHHLSALCSEVSLR